MSLPVVKSELIRNIGEQMGHYDKSYFKNLEIEFIKENPALAKICSDTINVLNSHIDDKRHLEVAQWISRITCLIMYNALKQQSICDELE